jgi:hypothetical protein
MHVESKVKAVHENTFRDAPSFCSASVMQRKRFRHESTKETDEIMGAGLALARITVDAACWSPRRLTQI